MREKDKDKIKGENSTFHSIATIFCLRDCNWEVTKLVHKNKDKSSSERVTMWRETKS